MKTQILAAILLAALAPQSRAEAELKGQPAELAAFLATLPPTVTVSGEGEVKAQADRAILSFNVTTEARLLRDALQANQEVRNKLAGLLKGRGIEESRIQAGRFSSTERHAVFSDKIKSHRVDNAVKVTVHNEQEFQGAAGAGDKLSEVSFLGVEFEHSEKEQLKARAVSQACDNANRRKQAFEGALGLRLSPKRFFDGPPAARQFPPAERLLGVQGGTAPSFGATVLSPLPGRSDSEVTFGEIIFRAQVTIEYAVEK